MKVYFENTGCSLELEDFCRFIRLTGCEETKNFYEADVIIVHFCGLSKECFETIPKHMAILKELKNYNGTKLYVGGCASEVVNLEKRYPFVDGVFRKRNLIEDLAKYFGYNPKADENLPISCYGGVRIQTGCMRNCSFCKKAYLQMPLNSKAPSKVIADIKSAVSEGFHNIMLFAENSTEYGIDLSDNVRLIDLLKSIVQIDGVKSLDVYGLCMDELVLNPALVDFLRNCEKIHKIQLEIQSLIPEVRKNMGLSSSVDDVLNVLSLLKRKFIVTNIMLGFPGETDSNFDEQLRLIEKHNLYFVQTNIYDDTPCVPAHALEQIPRHIVFERMFKLSKTLKRIRSQIAKQMLEISKKEPIQCVLTSAGVFEAIGYSAVVDVPNSSECTNGERIFVKLTEIQCLIDELDYNQSLILKGVRVYE